LILADDEIYCCIICSVDIHWDAVPVGYDPSLLC